jgi:hypothetical protein
MSKSLESCEWKVVVPIAVDELLHTIRNKSNPDYQPSLYQSAWFETKEEAQVYAFEVAMATAKICQIMHRDDIKNSLRAKVLDILRSKDGDTK